jgi:hypothetical protein
MSIVEAEDVFADVPSQIMHCHIICQIRPGTERKHDILIENETKPRDNIDKQS